MCRRWYVLLIQSIIDSRSMIRQVRMQTGMAIFQLLEYVSWLRAQDLGTVEIRETYKYKTLPWIVGKSTKF